MKTQSCLMIRLIVVNNINTQEVFSKLESYIKKYFTHATISLVSNEQYWKYPECNEIIYNVSNDEFIKVSDLIKHFIISWIYKDRYIYSVDLNRQVWTEDAIWSQNCHSEETFLMSEIEWVNIYTWKDEKSTIID